MKLYRAGVEIADITIDEKTTFEAELQGSSYISCEFTLPTLIDIQKGDYTLWRNEKYYAGEVIPVEKEKTNSFDYSFKMYDSFSFFKDAIHNQNNDLEFNFFGNLQGHIQLLAQSVNKIGAITVTLGVIPETEPKNLTFINMDCESALMQICDAFGFEFEFKQNQLSFYEKIGNNTGLTFEFKKGIRNIERNKVNNASLVTKLYVFGGEMNLPKEYGSKRLRANPLTKNTDKYGIIEGVKIFEDIYPKREGTISAIGQDIFHFTDNSLDFDINNQLIEGKTAKVTFTSGALSGQEFEIHSYNHETKEFDIISFQDSTGETYPNETFKPSVGDKYVLHDIIMPQSYIDNAVSKLIAKGQEYLNEYSKPPLTYDISLDHTKLRRDAIELSVGDILTVNDADFGVTVVNRIISFSQSLVNPYKYNIKVGDKATISVFKEVLKNQNSIQNSIKIEEWQRLIAIREAIARAKNYTDKQLSSINTEITDVKSAIDDLQGGIDDAVNNGDIDANKISDIEAKRDALIAQKNNIEPIYSEVYNDANLAGMPKTALGTEKSELDTTHTELITAINNAIQAGKVEGAEKTAIDAKFDTYSADITALHTALENALSGIESKKIAQAEADAQAQIDALPTDAPALNLVDLNSIIRRYNDGNSTIDISNYSITVLSNSYSVAGYLIKVNKNITYTLTYTTQEALMRIYYFDGMPASTVDPKRYNYEIDVPSGHTFTTDSRAEYVVIALYASGLSNYPTGVSNIKLIEEGGTDNTAEIDAINNAKQQAIQEAQDYTTTKNAVIDTELGLLETKLIDLKTAFDGAISGVGVITPSENASIEATTNLLKVEKKDIDSKYAEIYSNEKLTGTHKSNLSTAKTEFDTASAELINAINSSISDANVTPNEKTDIDTKFDAYGSKLSNLRIAFEQAIKSIEDAKVAEAEQNSKAYVDNQLSTLQNDMQATQDAINNFDADFDTAVLDGVIDRTEKIVIEKHIRIIEETMGRASSSYSKVYTNPFLTGSAKTSLRNAKINLWGKRDELIDTINSAISNNSVTQGEKDLVDQKFGYFNTAMGAFQSALEEASKNIQANIKAQTESNAETIAENKANEVVDDVEFGSVNLLNGTKEFVQAVSQGVVTSTSGRTYYKYGYGWGFRISSSNIEKMVVGKEYTISIDVYNPSSNNTTARIIYSGNHNYIDIGGELETTASITFVYQNETPDIRFLTSDPNLPPVYWGFPILTKGNRPTAWQSSEADKQINIDQAKEQAMDNIAKKIGYSDYSDMVAKALAKGPLVDVQGLLNAEIVNAEAVWAKIIEATLITANSIISQNNGFSVAINADPNAPYIFTRPTGEVWKKVVYKDGEMREEWYNRNGDVMFYIGEDGKRKDLTVPARWINRKLRSLGTSKSYINKSSFGFYRDSYGNIRFNTNTTNYYEYVSGKTGETYDNPDEHHNIYKSQSYSASNKINNGYYYGYYVNEVLRRARLDNNGSPIAGAGDIVKSGTGEWYIKEFYHVVNGQIQNTYNIIFQI